MRQHQVVQVVVVGNDRNPEPSENSIRTHSFTPKSFLFALNVTTNTAAVA